MKKICTFLFMIVIAFNVYSESLSDKFEEISVESNKLFLLSAHLYEAARSYNDYSKDSLILKSAANIAGRYAMEIINVTNLYSISMKMQTEEDVKTVSGLLKGRIVILSSQLIGEKNPLFGAPKFLDPLVLDNYQARRELASSLDEFEKLGNRLLNLSELIE